MIGKGGSKELAGERNGGRRVYLSLGFGGLGEPESGEKTRSLLRRGVGELEL